MRIILGLVLGLVGVAGLVNVPSVAVAQDGAAKPGGVRAAVEAAIALEEKRMGDLQRLAASNKDAATTLEVDARNRDASAADFYARSKEFASAAAKLKGPSRETVLGFSTAMNVYARNDQEMAEANRKAAGILNDQVKAATAGVEAHGKHIAQLRQSIEDWK